MSTRASEAKEGFSPDDPRMRAIHIGFKVVVPCERNVHAFDMAAITDQIARLAITSDHREAGIAGRRRIASCLWIVIDLVGPRTYA